MKNILLAFLVLFSAVGYGQTPPTGSKITIKVGSVDTTAIKNSLQRIRTVTSNATVLVTDYTIIANAASGNITIALPASNLFRPGTVLNIKKADASANTVTIDANGTELIDEALTYVLTIQWEGINIQTNGTAWFIL